MLYTELFSNTYTLMKFFDAYTVDALSSTIKSLYRLFFLLSILFFSFPLHVLELLLFFVSARLQYSMYILLLSLLLFSLSSLSLFKAGLK